MKNIKHYGKRWLALVLSLVMCFGLLQTTALAANWQPGDQITINVRVFDQSTGKTYEVGTDYATKGDVNIQTVNYKIPALTQFVKADQFGRVEKVVGNWYFPSGDSQPGANVEWSCNVNKVTMTYWVNWFSTGSGTGGNTSETIDLGGSGRNTINFTIRYHSNYPTGTNYTATKTYTVKSYATIYNVFSSQFLTYTACGFGGFTPKATEKTWYTTAACTAVCGTIGATNGGVYDLYAGWESAPEPVQTLTLTYKDGDTVYRSISGFSSGDDVLLLDYPVEKAGYTFAGWSKTPGSTTAEYKAGEVFTITQNTTLYAVWVPAAPATTTLTVSKIVAGDLAQTQLPSSFSMTATIINGSSVKTVFLSSAKLEDSVEISTAADAMVVLNESGYAVDGYDCTSVASNGSAVVNGNVTVTIPAGTLNPVCSITNTYMSAAGPVRELSSITKERITSANKGELPSGFDLSGINISGTPQIPADFSPIKLLYKISVTGTPGTEFTVTDVGTNLVAGYAWDGVIAENGVADIYVTKDVSLDMIVDGDLVENVASVVPIGDAGPVGGLTSNPVSTRVYGRIISNKTGTDLDSQSRCEFKIEATNKMGVALASMTVVDELDSRARFVEGTAKIVLVLTNGTTRELREFSYTIVEETNTATWHIDEVIPTGAVVCLTYDVVAPDVKPDDPDLLNKYRVNVSLLTSQSYGFSGDDISIGQGDFLDLADDGACLVGVSCAARFTDVSAAAREG